MATGIKKISVLIVVILAASLVLAGFIVKNTSFANSAGFAAAKYIGEERAKEIALKDAKVSASDAKYLHAYLDRDDRVDDYDVKFYYGGKEYEYEIDASTGSIIDKSVEREYVAGNTDTKPAAPANNTGTAPANDQASNNTGGSTEAAPAQNTTPKTNPSPQPSNNSYYYDDDYYDYDYDDYDDRYDDYDDYDDRYDDDYDDDWDD